jgi:hypothetical protein
MIRCDCEKRIDASEALMYVYDEEILRRLKTLPLEQRNKIIDGCVKMLAVRPHRFSEELRSSSPEMNSNDVPGKREG